VIPQLLLPTKPGLTIDVEPTQLLNVTGTAPADSRRPAASLDETNPKPQRIAYPETVLNVWSKPSAFEEFVIALSASGVSTEKPEHAPSLNYVW
jgi:hypothetical protein